MVIPTPALPPLKRELENEVPVQKSITHSIKRSYDLDGRKCLNISESAKTHGLPLKKERKAISQQAHLLLRHGQLLSLVQWALFPPKSKGTVFKFVSW